MGLKQDLADLLEEGRRTELVRRLLELARDEDLDGFGDVTSLATIEPSAHGRYDVAARQGAVVAGLGFVHEVLEVFSPSVTATLRASDGDRVGVGAVVATLEGPTREILTVERTLLNLICRLSGVATRTASFVEAMGPRKDGRPELCDTRKTTPGMRIFEKYAVRCGGGSSHRLGLHDAVLIKDNHLAGLSPGQVPGAVRRAIDRARELRPHALRFVEVEVDGLDQLAAILNDAPPGLDIVLLDNMPPAQLREAVAMRDASGFGVKLEASGGVTLATIREIAATGVDRVSVGSLTHGAVSIDFGLDAAS